MNQATLKPLWLTRLDYSPATNFLVAGDLLVATVQAPEKEDSPAYLFSFSCADGALGWFHEFEDHIIGGLEAAVNLDTGTWLFLTTANRDFFLDEVFVWCYDQNGDLRWQWRGDAQTISAPVLHEDLLSFAVDSEQFIHLDATTGTEQLRLKLDMSASFAAPCWHEDIAYIPGNGPHIMAVNSQSKKQWQFQTEGTAWLDKTPAVAGNLVLSVSSQGTLLALNANSGTELWQAAVGPAGRQLSPPTTQGQRVYVGARDGLHALDVENGKTIWSFLTERSVSARPVIYNKTILFTCHDHNLYALNENDGKELWRYQMARQIELPPLVGELDDIDSNVTIYAVDRGGQIVAIPHHLQPTAVSTSTEDPFTSESTFDYVKQLESDGEITQAAEAWFEAGNLERAAEYFELAEKWQRAAELWQQLGRYLKYAQALEGYAHSIEDEPGNIEERIAAWAEAAAAYKADGEKAKAEYCQLQVAKYEKRPVLDLSIEHDGLVLNVWSKLKLTIINNGFGPARNVDILVSDDQFAGQVASSKYLFKLLPHNEKIVVLTVRPLQYGESVPMKLTLNYQDNKAEIHRLEKTVFVPVVQKRSDRVIGQIQNVFATAVMPGSVPEALTPHNQFDLADLRRNLSLYFSINELNDICFELNIDPEELIRDRKSDFTREIVLYLHRRGRLQDLITFCRRVRPHIGW